MMFTTGEVMVRRYPVLPALIVSLLTVALAGQQPRSSAPQNAQADDPSGMYSFLKEGEFVQLSMDDGKLSGYASRFGDSDSDKTTIIDQFFDKASLEGNRLSFTT